MSKDRVVPHPTQFARVEKNLAALGFFSPSKKNVRDERSKTIRFTRVIDGNRVETAVIIEPSASYGLPVTADQDRYLAFQQLLTDRRKEQGALTNPVGFTSASLNVLMGKGDAGKNFDETADWLKRMTLTGIVSEGVVYLAKRKVRASDTFHVFDRAVSVGKEMPNGDRATQNYVWLSSWQLENLNSNYVVPLDLDTYRDLTKHIAKALVPLLQVWLYASERQGLFGKRYDELCEILNIRHQTAVSKIRQQLQPSLDELVQYGYLKRWAISQIGEQGRTKRYKVVFYHGTKFYRDRRRGAALNPREDLIVASSDEPPDIERPQELVDDLIMRGVSAPQAKKLLSSVADGQDVRGQMEWIDAVVAADPARIRNPAGLYVALIRDNVSPPASFDTSHKRHLREQAAKRKQSDQAIKARLKLAYERYLKDETTAYLQQMAPAEYEQRIASTTAALKQQYTAHRTWPAQILRDLARTSLARDVQQELSLTSFSDFRQDWKDDGTS